MDEQTDLVLQRWQDGDDRAADEIVDRYLHRLVALARTRLDGNLRKRVDPEDVVQSAYGSFFRRASEGAFELRESGDLWRLLATITVNKSRKQFRFHTAQKRSIFQEAGQGDDASVREAAEAVTNPPTPDEAMVLVEELEEILSTLDSVQRQIVEMRMAGSNVAEIASESERTERTVRRVIDRFGKRLEQRLNSETP